MSGLIDAATGLKFGTGLQFETEIGTSGLQIKPSVLTEEDVVASDGSIILTSDGSTIVTAS